MCFFSFVFLLFLFNDVTLKQRYEESHFNCCCLSIQVLGFAVFFALVLKTVDQEEYGDIPIEGALSSTGSL